MSMKRSFAWALAVALLISPASAFRKGGPIAPPPPPVNTALPVVTPASPVVGTVENASTGTWSNSPISYSYQWFYEDTATLIGGASTSSYTPVTADLTHTLQVKVTAANPFGSASAFSAPTSSVAPPAPANTALPTVTPTNPLVGTPETATSGTWTNSPTFTYQWFYADTSALVPGAPSGAFATSYTPVSADVGHTLKVTVTAANVTGSAAASSAATAAVANPVLPPANTALPTMTPTNPVVGTVETATTGSWTGAPSYSYQWLYGDTSGVIPGSPSGPSASSYTPVSADVGHTLEVKITATNSAGSVSATSPPTVSAVALPPTVATIAPAAGWNGTANSGGPPPASSRQLIVGVGSDASASNCGGTAGCVQLTVPSSASVTGGGTGGIGAPGSTPIVYVSGVDVHTEADVAAVAYVVDGVTIDLRGVAYNASGGTFLPTTPNWAIVSLARGARQITGVSAGANLTPNGVAATVRLTLANPTGAPPLTTGELLTVSGSPVSEANGQWTITVVDATHVDLGSAASNHTRYGPPLVSTPAAGGILLSTTPAGAGLDEYASVDMTTSPYYVTGAAISMNRHGIDHVAFYYEGSSANVASQTANPAAFKSTDGYVIGLAPPATGTASGIADLYMDAIPVMGLDRRVSIHTWLDMNNSGVANPKTAKVVTPLPWGGSWGSGEPANCAGMGHVGSFADPYASHLGLAIGCAGAGSAANGTLIWAKEPAPVNGVVAPPVFTDANSTNPSCGAFCLSNAFPAIVQGCDSSNGSSCQPVERRATGVSWAVCNPTLCPWVTDSAGHDGLGNIAGLLTLSIPNSGANAYPAGAATAATAAWSPVAAGGSIPVASCAGFLPGMNVIDPILGDQDSEIGVVATCPTTGVTGVVNVLTTTCLGDVRATQGCIGHGSIGASDPLVAGQTVIVEGMYPMEPNGIATVFKASTTSISYVCCFISNSVDMMDPGVVHSGAPQTFGTVAVPYIIEVCPVPYKFGPPDNCGGSNWGNAGRNVVYRDAILDLSTAHSIYPYRDASAGNFNVAWSVYAPPLNDMVTFQNSALHTLAGNEGPLYGLSLAQGSSPLAGVLIVQGFRTASMVESTFRSGSGFWGYALVRDVHGITGWTVEITNQVQGANPLSGGISETWFQGDFGMNVAPAPIGVYSQRGQVQPALERLSVEPGDNLTATPCSPTFAVGDNCMPAIAGNVVTATNSFAPGSDVVINLAGATPCSGVQGGMSIVDYSKSPHVNVGFVQPLANAPTSCSGGSLLATITVASAGSSDVLHIGEPIHKTPSCGMAWGSDCTVMFVLTSPNIYTNGPGVTSFTSGNCMITKPPHKNGYMQMANGQYTLATGMTVTRGSTTVTFASSVGVQGTSSAPAFLASNFFPVGTLIYTNGTTGTTSAGALISTTTANGTIFQGGEGQVNGANPPIAMLEVSNDFTGADASQCGDGVAANDGSGLAIGDGAFITAIAHTQMDKDQGNQSTSNAAYIMPELNLLQIRSKYSPELGFAPAFYQNGSFVPGGGPGTLTSSGLTVTCSVRCGALILNTTVAAVAGNQITLPVNCSGTNGGQPYNFVYDTSVTSAYPVGLVASCPTSGKILTLSQAPVFPVSVNDNLTILSPPTLGMYVNVTSGPALHETRMVMGSAGPLTQFVVDGQFSVPLSGASWQLAGSLPGLYSIDSENGGNTGYLTTPPMDVTSSATGEISGNEAGPGRWEESGRGKLWLQATLQAVGMYHQTGHLGGNGFYDDVILDSNYGADYRHSAAAQTFSLSQTMYTDTALGWEVAMNNAVPLTRGYYYDADNWAVTSGLVYPGINIATADAIINDTNFRPCSSATWPNGDDIMGCVWSGGRWQSSYGVGVGPLGGALPALRGHQHHPTIADGTPLYPWDHDGRPLTAGSPVGAELP